MGLGSEDKHVEIPRHQIDEGKYEIIEKLSEGGMGAVYKVRHRLLDEVRVIKVMRPHLVEDVDLRNRFLREARTAIKLAHANLIKIRDCAVDSDGNAYIVMEHLEGLNLEQILERFGPPPIAVSLEIAQQALDALAYLHRKEIVHRDISADNLMVTTSDEGRPRVVLIDLGIAKVLRTGITCITQEGVFVGKIRYSSPEQISGSEAGPIDQRSDLYSFAVVLCELLTGVFPLPGNSSRSVSLINAHLNLAPLPFTETDPQARVPRSLQAAVMKSLEKRPQDRHRSAEAFREELLAIQAAVPFLEEHLQQTARYRPLADSADFGEATEDRLAVAFPIDPPPPTRPPGTADETSGPEGDGDGLPEPAQPASGSLPPSAASLTEQLARVDLLFSSGRFAEAESALLLVEQAHGISPRTQCQRQKVEAQLERISRAVELAQAAKQDLQAERFEDAIAKAEQALEIDADSPRLRATLAEVRLGLRQGEQEQQKQEEIAKAVKEIEEQLSQGDLEAAVLSRDRALLRFGEIAQLEPLLDRIRLTEQEHRKREAEVSNLLEQARERVRQQDIGGAREVLLAAQTLDPDNSAVCNLIAETTASLQREENERNLAQGIADAATAIEEQLEGRDFEEASRLLREARDHHGATQVFATLKRRLAELVAEHARFEQLVGDAEKSLQSSHFESAILDLEQALLIDPESDRVSQTLDQARRGLARQKEVERVISDARADLDQRRFEPAVLKLEAALGLEPDNSAVLDTLTAARTALDQDRTIRKLRSEAGRDLANRRFQAAVAKLEEALAISPEDVKTQELLVEARQGLDQQKAIVAPPSKVGEHLADGSFQEAEVKLEQALALDPEDATTQNLHAEAGRRCPPQVYGATARIRVGEAIAQFSEPAVAVVAPQAEVDPADPHRPEDQARPGEQESPSLLLELTDTVADIEDLLERGELEEATRELEQAEATYGSQKILAEFRTYLEAFQQDAAQQEGAGPGGQEGCGQVSTGDDRADAVAEIAGLLQSGEFRRAHHALCEAVTVHGNHASFGPLRQRLDDEVDETAADIEDMAGRGEIKKAEQLLTGARETFGENRVLDLLAAWLAELRSADGQTNR